jgi:hypothetical protein
VNAYSARTLRRTIVSARPDATVTVEHTGGGVATISVNSSPGGRAWLLVGPGSYDWTNSWRSTFDASELSIGPDDDGLSPSAYPATLDDLWRYVAAHCQCVGCPSVNTYTHGLCAWCIEHAAGPHVEPTDD